MYGVILLSLTALATANVIPGCPQVSPVDNFNLEAYGTGTWYEVARYPNMAERGGQCGFAEYIFENNIIKLKNNDVINNKLRTIEGTARLADDAGTTGKLIFKLPYGPSGRVINSVLNVLATDYNNYSIVYYCNYNESKKVLRELTWVLSRSKKLEGDAKVTVDKFLKDSTFIDTSKLVWPDLSDEACRVDA